MASSLLSPGVYVKETDLTLTTPGVATSMGGIAGEFIWGPVNDITLVSNEATLVSRFGKPNNTTYKSFFTAKNFLDYSTSLQVIRVSMAGQLNAVATGTAIKIGNEVTYTTSFANSEASVGMFAAKYPGAIGNSLKVSLADAITFSRTLSGTVSGVAGSNIVTGTSTIFLTQVAVGSYVSVTVNGSKINFDVVFNAIHGTPGEDGLMQAYFELLNIPQTSCDYYQAALTFNKRDMLSVLKPYGIKTAESYYLNLGDEINIDTILAKVGLPCFVKPNKSGSSFGISKVKTREEFLPAIENAYKEDDEIIIESFLDGTEVSVGVINYKGTVTVLPITEIVSENDFFDYEAKYLGKSKEITPARISDELKVKIETVAKRAYEVLKMKGFSRSEFIIVNNEPHMLEMNTIPGLTTESILPQQAREAGISLPELFENAIELALKK